MRKPTSQRAMLCLGVVIAGFFIGSKGEVNFSMIGSLFGVGSSVFVALNGIFTEKFTKRACLYIRVMAALLSNVGCSGTQSMGAVCLQ
jgi:drug/metabolite transporter (DMT)-like permease